MVYTGCFSMCLLQCPQCTDQAQHIKTVCTISSFPKSTRSRSLLSHTFFVSAFVCTNITPEPPSDDRWSEWHRSHGTEWMELASHRLGTSPTSLDLPHNNNNNNKQTNKQTNNKNNNKDLNIQTQMFFWSIQMFFFFFFYKATVIVQGRMYV